MSYKECPKLVVLWLVSRNSLYRQRVADNRPLAYIRMKQLVMFHENPTGNVDNARRRSEIRYKWRSGRQTIMQIGLTVNRLQNLSTKQVLPRNQHSQLG